MYGGDEVSAIVVDIGSFNTRVGYASEDSPRVVYPSVISRQFVGVIPPHTTEGGIDIDSCRYIAGDGINYRRDNMKVQPIINQGVCKLYSDENWDLLEHLVNETISKELMLDPRDHPVLLTEPNITNRDTRTKMTELFFEKFQVPAMYISKTAVLSSFASGRSTSLVIDSGANMTTAVAVHDGFVLNKSIIRYNIGGETITDRLYKNLQTEVNIRPWYQIEKKLKCYTENGEMQVGPEFTIEEKDFPNTDPSFHEWSVKDIVRDIKETHCKITDNPYSEDTFSNVPPVNYELPDGENIELGNTRFSIPELMFNPGSELQDLAVGFSGVHQMIYDSITRSDMDIRKELYGNIVVVGGNTLFSGFTDRLLKKLNDLTTQNMKVKLIAPTSSIERKFSGWIGGSILASLGSFQQMWMSRQEYDEHGAVLIERKCL